MKSTHVTSYVNEPVAEGETTFLSGTFKDQKGVPIPGDQIEAVTLTLYEKPGGVVINSRNSQDIQNVNGGEVQAGGGFTLELAPGDNVIVGTGVAIGNQEIHVALIQFTYGGGRKGKKEIVFGVQNLSKVP